MKFSPITSYPELSVAPKYFVVDILESSLLVKSLWKHTSNLKEGMKNKRRKDFNATHEKIIRVTSEFTVSTRPRSVTTAKALELPIMFFKP